MSQPDRDEPRREYVPAMTPGREMYERWLAARDVPPDDLWDHLDERDRYAWEAVVESREQFPSDEARELRKALEQIRARSAHSIGRGLSQCHDIASAALDAVSSHRDDEARER